MFKRVPDSDVVQCWPTPLYLEDLESSIDNAALREALLNDERNLPSSKNSNATAWQSPDDLLIRHAALLAGVTQAIQRAMSRINAVVGVIDDGSSTWRAEAWATICRAGNHHDTHLHHGAIWSGTYYVEVPQLRLADESGEGAIEFLDPCHSARRCEATFRIVPRPGLLVLFPSWLQHWVRPHKQVGPRISIAFNLRCD